MCKKENERKCMGLPVRKSQSTWTAAVNKKRNELQH